MRYIPKTRPKLEKESVKKILDHYKVDTDKDIALLAIRGYYSKSMGNTDGNDINLYDDAIFVYGKNVFESYNFNTDPSFVNKGGRDLAMLDTGIYRFYKGRHKNKYNALRSYPEGVVLPCTRNGKKSTCSYINIHRGGINPTTAGVTWSEGCLTVPHTQWEPFIHTVYLHMTTNDQKIITVVLIDNDTYLGIVGESQ